LKRSEDTDEAGCFSKIPTETPFAFASGIFEPEIFVSRGLWEELRSDERDILLSHERAHITNSHGLTLLLAQILEAFHMPFVGRRLRRHVQLACEQIADGAAANRADSRLDVAELLVKIGRLTQSDRPRSAQLRFGSDQLSRRVVGLVERPWDKEKTSWLEPALLATAVVALLNYSVVHHFVESTLGMLH
jgi:beta-lactamase regulating signal transducer with metallopeptidase domain